MSISGQLRISLHNGNGKSTIQSDYRKPNILSDLLKNQSLVKVPSVIGLLFNLCQNAQTQCALSQIEQHLVITPDKQVRTGRLLLISLEKLRELLYQWHGIWLPLVTCDKPLNNHFPIIYKQLTAAINLLKQDSELNRLPLQRLDWHSDEIQRTWQTSKQCLQPVLNQLKQILTGDMEVCAFFKSLQDLKVISIEPCQTPARYSETSCFTQLASDPLVTNLRRAYQCPVTLRYLAKLRDMELTYDLIDGLFCSQHPDLVDLHPADNLSVNTSRGKLVHQAVFSQDKVLEYKVIAPTDINCGNNGILSHLLSELDPQAPNLKLHLQLVVHAISPCVPVNIEGLHQPNAADSPKFSMVNGV